MLNDLGWIVLRFTNEVILERTAMVLEQIQSVAQQRA
jgi:very-short-patch-repair endonuclease